MQTIGYLAVLLGVLLVRQVVKGRAKETPQDLRDLFVGFITADTQQIKATLTQSGTNIDSTGGSEVAVSSGAFPKGTTGDLVAEVMRLGNAAKGYRLGATGPDFYDCSGLVWRACRNLGYYDGMRFTTATFAAAAMTQGGWCKRIPESMRAAGDIILWRTHHMGVSTGGDGMYSARSTAKGIGESTVSGDSDFFGYAPSYWRVQIVSADKPTHSGVQDG